MKIKYLFLGVLVGALISTSFFIYASEDYNLRQNESESENTYEDVNLEKTEYYVESLVNYKRSKYNKNLLTHNSNLSEVSEYNSDLMVKNNYLNHTDVNGDDALDRINKFNVKECSRVGENLIKTAYKKKIKSERLDKAIRISEEHELAENIVNGWMNSTEHRRNVLRNGWVYFGTDVSINNTGYVYSTQMYCN